MGGKALLSRLFNKSLGEKYGFLPTEGKSDPKEPKHKGVGKKSSKGESEADKEKEETPSEAESCVSTTVHSMQSGVFALYKLLYSLRPSHVVMYDIEMSVVRQLEVYQVRLSRLLI